MRHRRQKQQPHSPKKTTKRLNQHNSPTTIPYQLQPPRPFQTKLLHRFFHHIPKHNPSPRQNTNTSQATNTSPSNQPPTQPYPPHREQEVQPPHSSQKQHISQQQNSPPTQHRHQIKYSRQHKHNNRTQHNTQHSHHKRPHTTTTLEYHLPPKLTTPDTRPAHRPTSHLPHLNHRTITNTIRTHINAISNTINTTSRQISKPFPRLIPRPPRRRRRHTRSNRRRRHQPIRQLIPQTHSGTSQSHIKVSQRRQSTPTMQHSISPPKVIKHKLRIPHRHIRIQTIMLRVQQPSHTNILITGSRQTPIKTRHISRPSITLTLRILSHTNINHNVRSPIPTSINRLIMNINSPRHLTQKRHVIRGRRRRSTRNGPGGRLGHSRQALLRS